jgi:hypothetical protein
MDVVYVIWCWKIVVGKVSEKCKKKEDKKNNLVG